MAKRRYLARVTWDGELAAESYLADLAAVQHLQREGVLVFDRDVTFFVGENGSGKSTLLEAIAVAFGFNAEGGSRSFHFSTEATHSELYHYLTLVRERHGKDGYFLRAESFYNVASVIDQEDRVPSRGEKIIDGYGGVSLHQQSHGESFLTLMRERFRGQGLYILDEPEAALSPLGQMSLLVELDNLVKRGAQFIIATHSPMLMAFPQARVYQFTEQGIAAVDYRETAHYQLMRRFLDDPERMLALLLDEEA